MDAEGEVRLGWASGDIPAGSVPGPLPGTFPAGSSMGGRLW